VAVLLPPEVFAWSAWTPLAVFSLPKPLEWSANAPLAVLFALPVVVKFPALTDSWRIRTHAAIGVWYRPRQCFCHRYDLKSRLVHANASTGVRPSSPA